MSQTQQVKSQTEKKPIFNTEPCPRAESWRDLLHSLYSQPQACYDAILTKVNKFWSYEEFRFGFYIFALISAVPILIFLSFMFTVIFLTSAVTSFIWMFFVFSSLAIGLMLLIPILFVTLLTTSIIVLGYDLYCYLLRSYNHKD
ncbi:uncharacterized protein B0P05DRAFT_534089 [Gilbertella persicaria]|uniref:uncharacterized protein n=1 Tax=Gilbertella persicaria TaxID=101096 RepID=UPI00221FC245|nr:uncharacterized protein B0P05DRAFT_534089 [Gilbertella persicaria]KAI8085882.1 hypothetical protein B0P05DRAFT_534089 [Gilbertella persicaria]